MFRSCVGSFLSILFSLSALPALAESLPAPSFAEPSIPEPLRPWIPWALETGPDGQDRRACPLDPRTGSRRCAWPGELHLDLTATGGDFAQSWQLFAESWVMLPGDAEAWPQAVESGGQALPVSMREGRPATKLPVGVWRLTGRLSWTQRPDALSLPATTGLVSLMLDGEQRPQPSIERGGRLWLRDPAASQTADEGDRLSLAVLRRIEDDLPLRVIARIELDVSGRAREIRIGPVPLAGGVPLALDSPLPARLESDGTLRVQVRPGRWVLDVTTYHVGAIGELKRAAPVAPWPEHEIWAFAARPDLRQVEVGGPPPIDPRQTRLPDDWSRLPVYRLGPGESLKLVEQRRGDPDPGPDRLTLTRALWLDFDGAGYSVQDRIDGELVRTWRLESARELELGQVQIDGQPVPINRLGSDDAPGAPGVEVRRGRLDLLADGRLETAPNRLPASGWALAFDSAQATLHLPPGWDLLAVSGVDNLPDTWLARWTLLDLFLVLILSIGSGRLWGWGWGLLALLALGLTWQTPDAPRLAWLHLLAAAALLRLLPATKAQIGAARLRGLVKWYFRLSLLALLAVGLPFLVHAVRDGLYPQLERTPWAGMGDPMPQRAAVLDVEDSLAEDSLLSLEKPFENERATIQSGRGGDGYSYSKGRFADPSAPSAPLTLDLIDPEARVQTGPGIPDWSWNRFELAWTGPVGQDDGARLWLLTPGWKLLVSLLGSLLLVLLGLRLTDAIPNRAGAGASLALLLAAGLGAAGLATPTPTQAGELPPPELLQELRARLLAPPDCLPECLDLPHLALRAEPNRLTLDLTLDATVAVAALLPGGAGGWMPAEIHLDGAPLDRLIRDAEDRLRVPLAAGRHRLLLAGPLPSRNQIDIPLSLAPRHVSVQADGWRVEGLDAAGRAGSQLQLVRLSEAGLPADRPLTQDALPPLLRVERRLQLGIDWRVETRIRRLSAPEFPLLLPVPLLPGEAVQTPGIQVDGGRVLAGLAPGARELAWTSTLEPVAALTLTASLDSRLSEVWSLDLSPMWHLRSQGLAPVHQRQSSDRWLPSWRPLPGETLALTVSRPAGVPGPTLTIDRVDYRVKPGRRGSEANLTLAVRSSRGGRHAIRLPESAEPLRLSVDGRSLPVPAPGAAIDLPLVPGSQSMQIVWRESAVPGLGFSPPSPDLGAPAVNLNLSLSLPPDRWTLLAGGPQMGPAVLFWSVLLVIAGLAAALGRSRLTPLRTHDWFLLGVGLSLSQAWVMLLVAGWLFALGLRRRLDAPTSPWRFNLTQIGLILLTLAALAALLGAVQQGLLGYPAMQIGGNGSSATLLNWYQDRGGPTLPAVWVFSVPMWVYRALMLGWALWLAFRLLAWLRWGWDGFSQPLLWRERQPRPSPVSAAVATDERAS